MFHYLKKNVKVINLKEFLVDGINDLGWESNYLSIRPPGFL